MPAGVWYRSRGERPRVADQGDGAGQRLRQATRDDSGEPLDVTVTAGLIRTPRRRLQRGTVQPDEPAHCVQRDQSRRALRELHPVRYSFLGVLSFRRPSRANRVPRVASVAGINETRCASFV